MRTALRLSAATLITIVASPAVAYAARYNTKGEVVPDPTPVDFLISWFPPEAIVTIVIAFAIPGMRMSVFWPFAGLVLLAGWKMAVGLSFGYYLLQFLMGGKNDDAYG
jgi:hypothetical protein